MNQGHPSFPISSRPPLGDARTKVNKAKSLRTKNLRRSNALRLGALPLLLSALPAWAACDSAGFGSITNLPTDGGYAFQVYALNAPGQLTGYFDIPNATSPHAFLWSNGTVTDLGTLGGPVSEGLAINSSGAVAGDSYLADFEFHAFLTQSNQPVDLGTLGGTYSTPYALNDAGQVAGGSYTTGNAALMAFLYSGGSITNLGTLGGTYSLAFAINSSGTVAGESTLTNGDTHGFFYTAGVMADIGTLGSNYSSAFALNDAGVTVGQSTLANGQTHAFLYASNVMVDLGTLGGTSSSAFTINRAGQVMGVASTVGDTETHGFIYGGGVMTDLGTLGGNYSSPAALNNLGQIVGDSALTNGTQHAFLWTGGRMVDLNTLLPANSGWELTSARFINDSGRIVGLGNFQSASQWFVLDTVPANQPPVAAAGPDQTVEYGTPLTLDGSGSTDPDGDTLSYQWSLAGTVLGATPTLSVSLPLGTNVVNLTVTDACGASAQTNVSVVVRDTTAPVIVSFPAAQVIAVGADCQGTVPNVLTGVVATDNCTPAAQLTLAQNPAAGTVLPKGDYVITVTVTDAAGNSSSAPVSLSMVDVTPPLIQSVTATPNTLNPPNGKLVPVTVAVAASDNCDAAPASKLISITCNYPTAPGDMQITGDLTALLAANKGPAGYARVYTLTVQTTDASGNSSTGTVTVTVPHNNDANNGQSLNAGKKK